MASVWEYFTDPVLRAPTLGCIFMCIAAALVGVVVLLRRQALVGEALSHATYPGVALGIIVVAPFAKGGAAVAIAILAGAALSALAGLWAIEALRRYVGIRTDAALCFVLAGSFGIGLTLASRLQFTHTVLYVQIQQYLYGQAATMTDLHVAIYGALAAVIAFAVFLLYKELQVITFDRDFANSLGIATRTVDTALFVLVVIAVVVGIRSVGVVLMSAMLIAPAAAARQFTNKMSVMLVLAALVGAISGFLGNYLSTELSTLLTSDTGGRLVLPTGPMIVLVATALTLLSLLLAPERGLLLRVWRVARFRTRCLQENILKTIWKLHGESVTVEEILRYQQLHRYHLWLLLTQLRRQGWVAKCPQGWRLTAAGEVWAAKIVRLHRLWELYLSDYVGIGVERVHRSAEEMEHILTPEIEEQLTRLLDNPTVDPHHQPIPPRQQEVDS